MFTRLFIVLIGVGLFIGCAKESNKGRLNQFSLLIDGTPWVASQSPSDPCLEAFFVSESMGPTTEGQEVEQSYYKIDAFQDPLVFEGASEIKNKLEIQVNGVRQEGTYVINGSDQENFQSYVRFSATTDNGEKKVYKNDQNDGFTFTIESFISTDLLTGLRGIAGHFGGTLYEVSNPEDSIILSQGEYLFEKINWHNFNQCAE